MPIPVQMKKIGVNPPPGWVKLKTDGSFSAANGRAGIGIVLRSANGLPIFTTCRSLDDCKEPLEASLRACVEGLVPALQNSRLPIIVESDCS
jgi:ribonuclease HI